MNPRVNLVILVALSVLLSGSTQQTNAHTTSPSDVSHARGQLVGTWRLTTRVVRIEDGTAKQDQGLGATPTGYLMYDSSGHMAVQIMKRDRSAAIECGISASEPLNNSQSVNGYDAYFGMYTIDESNHTVTHHLEGAIASTDVGKNLVREFQVSGDKLTIVVRGDSPKEKQIRILTWERVR